jgi:hypothetical protein
MIIYEPIYDLNPQLSNDFTTPYLFENTKPEWREFYLLTEIYKQGLWKKDEYVGILSPKFLLKTKINVSTFVDFIEQNKNFDVYFVNPFPQLQYLYFNVWSQGDNVHPGLINVADYLLKEAKIKINIKNIKRTNNQINCYSNFWVGNALFWENYVGALLMPLRNFIENNSNNLAVKKSLMGTSHTDNSPFLPFIVERLFTSYLYCSKDISYTHYPTETNINLYCLSDMELLIVNNLKDVIDVLDLNKDFNQINVTLLDQIGILKGLYEQIFFSNNPHPHTGRKVIISNN